MEEIRRGYHIKIEETAATRALDNAGAELIHATDEERANEILTIDGNAIPYIKSEEGFRIYYQPPKSDLISAARSYVDTQPEK